MTTNIKPSLLAPILGATIATFFMLLYVFLFSEAQLSLNKLLSIINIIPITFFLLLIISYIFSFIGGFILLKLKERYLWTDKLFWVYCTLTGLTIGLVIGLIDFYSHKSIVKLVFILLSFMFASLFNASFYTSLKEQINDKN